LEKSSLWGLDWYCHFCRYTLLTLLSKSVGVFTP